MEPVYLCRLSLAVITPYRNAIEISHIKEHSRH